MACLTKEISLTVPADQAWDAVRDFGAVHERLARGFVINTTMDDNTRIVTFANGNTAREMLVDCDDGKRRLAYAISNERVKHYNAVVQIVKDGGGSTFIWTVDVLPNEIAPYIAAQMDQAAIVMKATLEKS